MEQMNGLPSRKDLDLAYMWDLSVLFESDEDCIKELARVCEQIPGLAALKDTLIQSAADLLAGLRKVDEVSEKAERIYAYAHLKLDEDNQVDRYQGLLDQAMGMVVQLDEALSFMRPLLLSLEPEKLEQYFEEEPALQPYKFQLRDIQRYRAHILSEGEERLIALSGDMAQSMDTAYSMLCDADLRFEAVEVEEKVVELSHGRFIQLMRNPDRDVRRRVFESYYGTYDGVKNTTASLLAGSIKKDVFYAKARRYASCLEQALFDDNVPVSVYDSLIEAVRAHLPALHRYMELKKRALDLPDLHMYDVYVPLVETNAAYPYEDAFATMMEGLAPLGEDYLEILKEGKAEGWIDVYENRGKTSGAFSYGIYGAHPFVLLNHNDELDDLFTLAHEMGHAVHSYLSNKYQPYPTASYRIFVAEVASTVNEVLLNRHMLKIGDGKMRAYLLSYFLEQFRTTLFRQTQFAEFEKRVHAMAEAGEPLTAQTFGAVYGEINRDYYGPAVQDPEIALEWSRIPHFYRPFYVYQYATGFSSAVAIAKAILEGKPGAVENYKAFLSSGGSDHPLNLLKVAGVDLTRPEPVDNALKLFEESLGELEGLI